MKIFVSYSRADNDDRQLKTIEGIASRLGVPYIDDLHFDPLRDRHDQVLRVMREADAFLMVLTSNYLQTEWTRKEFAIADARRVLIYKFENGEIEISSVDGIRRLVTSRTMR